MLQMAWALMNCVPFQAQVGQGSQIPGGAQGTLLVNHGQDILVEHVNKALHRDKLRAGVPVREGLRLQEEHQPDNFRTHFLSGTAGVRHHQIVLQAAQVLLGDAYVVQGAESGGNPVNGPADILHLPVQVFAALDDGRLRLIGQDQLFFLVDNFFHSLQRETGM